MFLSVWLMILSLYGTVFGAYIRSEEFNLVDEWIDEDRFCDSISEQTLCQCVYGNDNRLRYFPFTYSFQICLTEKKIFLSLFCDGSNQTNSTSILEQVLLQTAKFPNLQMNEILLYNITDLRILQYIPSIQIDGLRIINCVHLSKIELSGSTVFTNGLRTVEIVDAGIGVQLFEVTKIVVLVHNFHSVMFIMANKWCCMLLFN